MEESQDVFLKLNVKNERKIKIQEEDYMGFNQINWVNGGAIYEIWKLTGDTDLGAEVVKAKFDLWDSY